MTQLNQLEQILLICTNFRLFSGISIVLIRGECTPPQLRSFWMKAHAFIVPTKSLEGRHSALIHAVDRSCRIELCQLRRFVPADAHVLCHSAIILSAKQFCAIGMVRMPACVWANLWFDSIKIYLFTYDLSRLSDKWQCDMPRMAHWRSLAYTHARAWKKNLVMLVKYIAHRMNIAVRAISYNYNFIYYTNMIWQAPRIVN